jgi:hypothetical protein
VGRLTAVCARDGCDREFEPSVRGGTKQLYCSASCKQQAHVQRKVAARRASAPNGAAGGPVAPAGGVDAVAEWQRPPFVKDTECHGDMERIAALAPPPLPWDA